MNLNDIITQAIAFGEIHSSWRNLPVHAFFDGKDVIIKIRGVIK